MPFEPAEIRYPPSVWSYVLPGGWHVWAGRTARDNDKLSTKVARNDDWWFHVSATRARFVSKPRGAKAGTVSIRREVVLEVRPALPEEEA